MLENISRTVLKALFRISSKEKHSFIFIFYKDSNDDLQISSYSWKLSGAMLETIQSFIIHAAPRPFTVEAKFHRVEACKYYVQSSRGTRYGTKIYKT